MLPAQQGDPARLTRLEVTATVPYSDDQLLSLAFNGMPQGVSLSGTGLVGNTIAINGQPGHSG